eukprot:gene27788-31390_t
MIQITVLKKPNQMEILVIPFAFMETGFRAKYLAK